MMVADELITVREAAERFGVTVPTVLRWIKARKINAVRRAAGRHRGYLVDPEEIGPMFDLRPVDETEEQP